MPSSIKSLIHATVATYVSDPKHRMQFLSDSWEDLTGYRIPDLLNFGFQTIVHPDDLPAMLAWHTRQGVGQVACRHDSRIITKSGQVKLVRDVSQSSMLGDGYSGTCTDITDLIVQGTGPHFLDSAEQYPTPARTTVRHLPTISFDMDGTLCNTYQAFLDILAEEHPEDSYDWKALFCSGNCRRCGTGVCHSDQNLDIRVARKMAFETPRFWSDIEPFDEDDLNLIRDQIQTQRYAAYFIATRRDLETPDILADARLLSLAWLERHSIEGYAGTIFDAYDKARELLARDVQYHIDDDPREVMRLRSFGIQAYLVSRPWNFDSECPYRVSSVREFLEFVAPLRNC